MKEDEDKTKFVTISVTKETKQQILLDKLEFAKRMNRDVSYDEIVIVQSRITQKIPWINRLAMIREMMEV